MHFLGWWQLSKTTNKTREIPCIGQNVEQLKRLCITGGNVKWCRYSYCGKQYHSPLKKLNTELPYDLAIPLLCIHLRRLKCTCSYKTLYTVIHICIKHSKQKVETTHMLTSKLINKTIISTQSNFIQPSSCA